MDLIFQQIPPPKSSIGKRIYANKSTNSQTQDETMNPVKKKIQLTVHDEVCSRRRIVRRDTSFVIPDPSRTRRTTGKRIVNQVTHEEARPTRRRTVRRSSSCGMLPASRRTLTQGKKIIRPVISREERACRRRLVKRSSSFSIPPSSRRRPPPHSGHIRHFEHSNVLTNLKQMQLVEKNTIRRQSCFVTSSSNKDLGNNTMPHGSKKRFSKQFSSFTPASQNPMLFGYATESITTNERSYSGKKIFHQPNNRNIIEDQYLRDDNSRLRTSKRFNPECSTHISSLFDVPMPASSKGQNERAQIWTNGVQSRRKFRQFQTAAESETLNSIGVGSNLGKRTRRRNLHCPSTAANNEMSEALSWG